MSFGENIYHQFPFQIKFLEQHLNQQLLKDFHGERTGFVQVGPKKYLFPIKFANEAQKYYNTEIRKDDIWIITFPRSGTTLMQELTWLIGNDLNFEKAAEIPLVERFPFFEYGVFFHDEIKRELLNENADSQKNTNIINTISKHGWEILPKMDFNSKRYIKTHLPFSLLPKDFHIKKCKAIYVARNPKDVIVSFYHLNRYMRTQGFHGSLEKYWEYFKQNLQPWMPFWSHLEEGWQKRNESNILFLFYENIIQDLRKTIQEVATFLGKSLNEIEIDKLENHLKIENLKKNQSVNGTNLLNDIGIGVPREQGFIRNGKINENDDLTEELNKKIDEWIEDNLRFVNIKFPKI